jgi:type IV pilus assembly protein PilW
MNRIHARRRARGYGGFSLVEILVGLAMGMLALIIVMQVFAVNEATKRTTTGGADATANGATALYLMERDVRMGGWGLDESLYLGGGGCTSVNTYCSGDASCGGSKGSIDGFSLASVLISDGADGGPDTVTVQYFANPNESSFVPPTSSSVLADGQDVTDKTPTLTVVSNYGCAKGNLVLISNPTASAGMACTLMQVSGDPVAMKTGDTSATLPHASDSTGVFNDPTWDGTAGKPLVLGGAQAPWATCFSPAGDGPLFHRIYSVDLTSRVLNKIDNTVSAAGTADIVMADVVDMQAQYGIAADGANTFDPTSESSWVDATSTAGWDNPVPKAASTGTTANRLQNIKAIRIALLVRSAQYEKPDASGTCSATKTADNPGTPGTSTSWSSWATFVTSKYPTNWNCYRYKSFEVVIPLRNVIWASV